MSRHPYTNSCDFIRSYMGGSRSEATQLRKAIAKVLGMSDEELAEKLSNSFQENEETHTDLFLGQHFPFYADYTDRIK